MSLLRTERWRIALCEDEWARVQLSGKGDHFSSSESIRVENRVANTASSWSGVVTQIRQWLSELSPQRRHVDILLSNHFARFAVVPWDHTARSEADLYALAEMALAPLLSGKTADWVIRLTSIRYGRNGLACAIPKSLLQELTEILKSANASVGSVAPCLSPALHDWIRRSSARDRVFLCAEGESLWALGASGDDYRWSRHFGICETPELVATNLRRQQILCDLDVSPEYFMTQLGGGDAGQIAFAGKRAIKGKGSVATAMLELAN